MLPCHDNFLVVIKRFGKHYGVQFDQIVYFGMKASIIDSSWLPSNWNVEPKLILLTPSTGWECCASSWAILAVSSSWLPREGVFSVSGGGARVRLLDRVCAIINSLFAALLRSLDRCRPCYQLSFNYGVTGRGGDWRLLRLLLMPSINWWPCILSPGFI